MSHGSKDQQQSHSKTPAASATYCIPKGNTTLCETYARVGHVLQKRIKKKDRKIGRLCLELYLSDLPVLLVGCLGEKLQIPNPKNIIAVLFNW